VDTSRCELKSQLIQHIGAATSIAESEMLFKAFARELRDCAFVFAAERASLDLQGTKHFLQGLRSELSFPVIGSS
jgi:hypothetical protein